MSPVGISRFTGVALGRRVTLFRFRRRDVEVTNPHCQVHRLRRRCPRSGASSAVSRPTLQLAPAVDRFVRVRIRNLTRCGWGLPDSHTGELPFPRNPPAHRGEEYRRYSRDASRLLGQLATVRGRAGQGGVLCRLAGRTLRRGVAGVTARCASLPFYAR